VGTEEGDTLSMRTLTAEELQVLFPKLTPSTYKRISKAAPRYNCMAFANGDKRKWWEPGCPGGRFRWPEDVKQSTVEAYAKVFENDGFTRTTNRSHDPEYEKIAIYRDSEGAFSHVTKSDGRVWKSKLGKGQDIAHASLDVLEGNQGDEYGSVDVLLQRRIVKK
jgi:hypothetical protein